MGKPVFFILASLFIPMLTHAQLDVATYNKERHQLVNYHADSDGNLVSMTITDDDMTTIMLNVDGTAQSVVNSLATLEFEYEDTGKSMDTKYTVDGQQLARCVYHLDEDVDFKKFKQEYQMYNRELNRLENLDKFLSQGGAQLVNDLVNHTINLLNTPIKACYEALTHNPYEEGKTTIVNADNLASIVSGISSVEEVMNDYTVGLIFERYNEWTADWASDVYKWQVRHLQRQKNLNQQVQGWREGIKEKVLRNEITIAEATEKITEIEKKRQSYKKMYAGWGEDVAVDIKEENGEEVVSYSVIKADGRSAEARNAPANGEANKMMDIVRQISEKSKYGRLDHVAITYYTPSNGEEEWSYFLENKKLVLKSHTNYAGPPTDGCDDCKREYPYYRLWIDYSNDVDPNVWGDVQMQLWVSPGGTVLNTYVIDCRGKQSEAGSFPAKTTGNQWFFIEKY